MQNNRHRSLLVAIAGLLVAGCEAKKDEVFQVAQCVIASQTVAGATPGDVGVKAGQAVADYLREHELTMSYDELSALAEKARINIVGDPELPMPTQIERAKQIMASAPCKSTAP